MFKSIFYIQFIIVCIFIAFAIPYIHKDKKIDKNNSRWMDEWYQSIRYNLFYNFKFELISLSFVYS